MGDRRALLWLVALVAAPLLGFFTALGIDQSGSAVLAWVVLLGLPGLLTILLGRQLRIGGTEVVLAGVASAGVAFLCVVILLWYLFEVVGIS